MLRTGVFPELAPKLRRLLIALCAVEFLEWLGGGALIPLLPTYLRQRGATPALVGVVMAAYFAAGVLTQYLLGRLCDRVGARPVVVGGLVSFALASVGFLYLTGAWDAVILRGLQGVGSGAVTVAGAASIAVSIPARSRGAAFGALNASQTLALALGPLVGGFVGAASMRWLFVSASAAALLAVPPAAALIGGAGRGAPRLRHREPVMRSSALVGAAAVFFANGFMVGTYEACWSLLLHLRGADTVAIGLSWTLFCLPYATFAPSAGRLADRGDRRRLVVGGILVSALFALCYPLLHSVALLVSLGCLEAVGAVLVTPAAFSVLADGVGAAGQGGAQGLVGTIRTGATAVAAGVGGFLFGHGAALPFIVLSAVLGGASLAVAALWRDLPARLPLQRGGDGTPGDSGLGAVR